MRLGCRRPVEAAAAIRAHDRISGGRIVPAETSAGLASKTSDAIHRVLSNAYTYFDSEDEPQGGDIERLRKRVAQRELAHKPTLKPTSLKPNNIDTGQARPASSQAHPKPPTMKRHYGEPKEPASDNPMAATNLRAQRSRSPETLEDGTKLAIKPNRVRNESTLIVELMGLLLNGLDVGQLVDQVKYRNRTTRLADDDGDRSKKNPQLQRNPTGEGLKLDSDNVHLLCRLLHEKLLANDGSNATNHGHSLLPTTSETRPKSTSIKTTLRPSVVASWNQSTESSGTILLLEDESELSQQNHESWLLESISRVGPSQIRPMSIVAASETLGALFEAAWQASNASRAAKLNEHRISSTRLAKRWNTYIVSKPYDDDVADMSDSQNNKHLDPEVHSNPFKLHIVDSLTQSNSNQVSLVFFLLKRVKFTGSRGNFWRVFNFEEAQALLDKLEHLVISREFERRNLSPMLLLAPFSRQNRPTNVADDRQLQPPEVKVPDEVQPKEQPTQMGSFIDKFTRSSFTDNLFLYLILVLILLFVLALCCSIAMLCRRKPPTFHTTRLDSLRQHEPLRPDAARPKGFQSNNFPDQLGEAIWRKLSNTTTTLLEQQDNQTYRIQEAARLKSLRADHLAAVAESSPKARQSSRQPFEWYPAYDDDQRFEDERQVDDNNKRRSNAKRTADGLVPTRDHKNHASKSVQTSKHPANEFEHKHRLIEISATNESKNSNTLTKSELVMLKEKLVPILASGDDRRSPSHRQVASQTSDPLNMDSEIELDLALRQAAKRTDEAVYLNRQPQFLVPARPNGSSGSSVEPSKYIDDSLGSLSRKLADLPAKSQSQVNAIKGELSRLERRDRSSNNELDQQQQQLSNISGQRNIGLGSDYIERI